MPALTPSTFHWYEGLAPPFTGVAVKVTDDPGQNGFEDAVIETPSRQTVVYNHIDLVTGSRVACRTTYT